MNSLFRITTQRCVLVWSARPGKATDVAASRGGVARVTPHQPDLVLSGETHDQEGFTSPWDPTVDDEGPLLFEYTDYHLYLEGNSQYDSVEIRHADTTLLKFLRRPRAGHSLVHGIINFGGQIGRSSFSIWINGQPEFDLEVEVFPSKIDYVNDYLGLIAELQTVGTAIALEYLRATTHAGRISQDSGNTPLEWATLLRHGIDELEAALRQIATHPHRAIDRTLKPVRPDQLKRIGTQTRKALLQNLGKRTTSELLPGIYVPAYLPERIAELTLDNPEHRWIAAKLQDVRRQLAALSSHQRRWEKRDSRAAGTRLQLELLEQRIAILERLPFCAVTRGRMPPGSFNSLTLLTAPGYREAYRVLSALSRGLHVSLGAVTLSTKDLHILYEYWAFLTVLRIVAEELGQPFPADVLSVSIDGLRATLQVANNREITFRHSKHRVVRVAYKPKLHGDAYLVAQEPDILISIEDSGWPLMTFVLDAKYRLDDSRQYVQKYGYPGPPEEALNVLHRYRDAILHQVHESYLRPPSFMRTVVEAAALYPGLSNKDDDYRSSRLYG